MSLTVVKRPHNFGYAYTDTATSITISDNSGDALVNHATHGLSTGTYVYLNTDVSSYNGLWYISVIDANSYEILEYGAADPQEYIVAATGTSRTRLTGTSLATLPVHLPMVYKIQSNLWPVNSSDTARTVSSFTNYNGYTALSLSGTLHTGSTVLEAVTIVGTSSLDGVYRIINWFSASSIVIDLAYDASNSFSGGTVQYYYMNYHARVRVYAGISSGSFTTLKPVELVAELRCLPDAEGIITVNINEFVKKKIGILDNDTLSPTLPYNIDANANFYISIAESYNDSDGYTISEYVSSYTDDTAAIAVNAKIPFKTIVGGLGDYLIGTNALGTVIEKTANFLTLFSSPVMTPDKYFDISFITRSGTRTVVREIYVNDVKVDEFSESIAALGPGIYRYSIEQSGHSEDRVDLTVYSGAMQATQTITITVDNECSNNSVYITWLNYLGGFDYWNFTAKKTSSINVLESRTQVKNIFPNWPNSYGETADTIRQNTFKTAQNSIRVESGNLTVAQVDGIKGLFSSPVVQIVTSASDKRTIIVDTNSVVLYNTQDNIFTVAFDASYTDDIPSQSL